MEMIEDRVVQQLLDDIELTSRQIYFGTDGIFICFSDGRFLERADSLPPAIDQLRYPFPNTLSMDMIKKLIPQDANKFGEIPHSVEEDGEKVKLLCKKYTCVVASVCFGYLKMRYPEAFIYCLGKNKPVVFLEGEIVRVVLMPIRT
jgi:hypothetical protein